MVEVTQVVGCKNKWVIAGPLGVVKPQCVKPIIAVVVHHTGAFNDESCLSWFVHPGNKNASAHYLVGIGGKVWQFVQETERAWHAGKSALMVGGVLYQSWNMFSIGVELTGDGNQQPYQAVQYLVLEALLGEIVVRYGIQPQFVVGHQDICPQLKVDPGKYFDWVGVRERVFG